MFGSNFPIEKLWTSYEELVDAHADAAAQLPAADQRALLHDTAMRVIGPSAPLWRGASANPGDGAWQRSWLYYQASSIWAGTNEIQRNILSERVLGLPREPT